MRKPLYHTMLILAMLAALASCSSPTRDATPGLPPVTAVRTELTPRRDSQEQSDKAATATETAEESSARRPLAQIFRGTETLASKNRQRSRSASVTESGDITLNFVNVDVRDFVKAVLGDYLKLNYVVDPSVQGSVTIQTVHPLNGDAMLAVLDTLLKMNGLTLLNSGDVYQVVPAANAPRQSGLSGTDDRTLRAGLGVEIVPLRYVGAAEMQRLMEPLVPSGSVQEVDAARNILIIAGTRQELATMREDIALFDVDWLAGMSFALFSPRAVDAKTLAKELGEVVGGRDSPFAGLVRLVPLERQNIVLAISRQPKYLEELKDWVERLDQPGESADKRIYVYRVQHGRAKDLAGVLTKVLNGGGGRDVAANAVRPGETSDAVTQSPYGLGPPSQPGRSPPNPAQSPALGGEVQPAPPGAIGLPDGEFRGGGAGDPGITAEGLKGIHITADEVNNALVFMATPKSYAIIEAALKKLDIVPLQVLLEAAIAEVTLTKDLQFGLQYFFQRGNHQLLLTDGGPTIAPSLPGFAYTFASNTNIRVVLSALDTVTHVDVISSPEVFVLNNQTAILQVGDQVPIATQQAVSVITTGAPIVNSIEFRDTGVILKVTPRVNEGGMVMMDISQEVSDVSSTTTSALNSPTITQRKISSTVAVQDGETVALGGLIKDNVTKTRNGIPLLQEIPVVGGLFRTTEDQRTRTELLVLITPHVVENLQAARSVTDELRRKLPLTQHLFERTAR